MSASLVMSSPAGAILTRVIQPEESDLSPEAARAFLSFAFRQRDRARMTELSSKNTAGELSSADRMELDSYLQIGMMLDLLQAKARLSLAPRKRRKPAHG